LTLDLVVSHAVDLADAAGLDAVTIPKVAEAVGCSTMALYRHVSSKDELLILMTDLAAGVPPKNLTSDRWRNGLKAWAEALYAAVSAHPWITQAPISGPPSGPGHIAWLDAALRTLRETSLRPTDKVTVVTLISGYVHQAVRLAVDHAAVDDDPDGAYQTYAAALAELVEPSLFPDAAQVFTAESLTPDTSPSESVGDYHFHFGLELILNGVERKNAMATGKGHE